MGVDEGQVKEPVVGREDEDQDQDESQDHDNGQGTCSQTRRRRCTWPQCSPRSGWSSSLHCSDRDPKIQLGWDGSSSREVHLDEQTP